MKLIFDETTKSNGDMSVKMIAPLVLKAPAGHESWSLTHQAVKNMFSYL